MTAIPLDGPSCADAPPNSSTVVTRRATETGFEYLLLHRSHAVNTGPWAWTPPSGQRLPGEAVHPAALRRLHEGTGLTDTEIRPVDLGRNHALWMTRDITDRRPVLNHEHDDYIWVGAEESTKLCQPSIVASSMTTVDAIPDVEMDFRSLTDNDFALLSQWSHRRHLTPAWFHRALTTTGAADRYRACLDPDHPINVHILRINGVDVGIAQLASVADLPDHLAATGKSDDIAIGFAIAERRWIGKGLGPQLIWSIICRLVMPRQPTPARVVAFTARGNRASARALHKAGFTTDGTVQLGGRRRTMHCFNPGYWLGNNQ